MRVRWLILLILPSFRSEDGFSTSIEVIIDNKVHTLNATPQSNTSLLAAAFCEEHSIANERCSHFVQVDLDDRLWCGRGRKALAGRLGVAAAPRLLRFIHHEHYADSEEFSLLRPRLVGNGFVECTAGLGVTGEEDAVWLLGHLSDTGGEWLYDALNGTADSAASHVVNSFPNSGHLGNKDDMLLRLQQLGGHIGDASTNFIPRTWSPAQLRQEETGGGSSEDDRRLLGLWIQKDPYKELGSGISLVRGTSVASLASCSACVLQRYVEDPFLLDGKKFSLGVYTAFTGVEPLSVWLHREMLILVCTNEYTRDGRPKGGSGSSGTGDEDDIDTLAHLSNGLLNRRLNPGEEPECEGCAYNATEQVWTTDRFLAYLAARDVPWAPIERQLRRIILTTFVAAADDFVGDLRGRVPPKFRARLFSHWRFDFLLDASGGAWLLEAEIVPSTGTIGGVDEVIKTVVLRDILSLAGWGPMERAAPAPPSEPQRRHCGDLERVLDPFDRPAGGIPCVQGDEDDDIQWSGLGSRGPLGLDVDLCERQVVEGSWSHRLCTSRLLDTPVPAALGTKSEGSQLAYWRQLERRVEALLRAAGDSLWLDAKSVAMMAAHEEMRRRRLGYEALLPVLPQYTGMDGAPGTSDAQLVEAEDMFLATKAMPADVALWRWESAKARLRAKRDASRALGAGLPVPWPDLPALEGRASSAQCRACLEDRGDFIFCASFAGPRTADADGRSLEATFRGNCQARWQECRDRPTGFLDGVPLSSSKSCDELLPPETAGGVSSGQLLLLWKARAHGHSMFNDIVEQFCDRAFGGGRSIGGPASEVRSARREMCSLEDSVEEMSRAAFELAGADALIKRGRPVVIRANERPKGPWTHEAFAAAYGDVPVTAMAFDGAQDSAQAVYTTELPVLDFVSFSVGQAFAVDGREGGGGGELSLYLLLTTRGENHGNANPNANLSEPLRELLVSAVPAQFALDGVEPRSESTGVPNGEPGLWAEAWTSLRLGGKYKYPTHIDCFENMILQLSGDKTVRLLPPSSVSRIRPDPLSKHWPTGPHDDIEDEYREHGLEVVLSPGDQLFVPLMWFHSVSAGGWSTTANRYYYSPSDWEAHIERSKGDTWKAYEEAAGVRLC